MKRNIIYSGNLLASGQVGTIFAKVNDAPVRSMIFSENRLSYGTWLNSSQSISSRESQDVSPS
jgi:hypothetical protein